MANSRFKLYDTGNNLLYTFPVVQSSNAPQSPERHLTIEGVRGKGALIIDSGTPAWDLTIRGFLMIDNASEGYDELTDKIVEMETTIALNTPYKLRIYQDNSNYWEYFVKRIEAIKWGDSLRTDLIEYECEFLVNSW